MNCEHYDPDMDGTDSRTGTCYFWPPLVFDNGETIYAETLYTDTCNEFKRRVYH